MLLLFMRVPFLIPQTRYTKLATDSINGIPSYLAKCPAPAPFPISQGGGAAGTLSSCIYFNSAIFFFNSSRSSFVRNSPLGDTGHGYSGIMQNFFDQHFFRPGQFLCFHHLLKNQTITLVQHIIHIIPVQTLIFTQSPPISVIIT